MRVLVTGAEGFIGSHLVSAYLEGGFQVKALVQYNSFGSTGWLEHLPETESLEIVFGDLRDAFQMHSILDGIDIVAHLGALIAIPYSYSSPDAYVATNVQGTLNVLNASRSAGVKQFIHTSTSEVYGTARYVPIDENHPIQAQSPYSASKIGADAIVRSFVDSFSFPATTIRPFNTFGPRQSQRAVIPSLGLQFLRRTKTLNVGALHPTRDFTYVSDTASAFVAATLNEASLGEVINLGTGWEISVSGIIEILREITGHNPQIVADSSRMRPESSEVERLMSDNSKARTLLGWEPKYVGETGFTEALKLTLTWLQSQDKSGKLPANDFIK